MVSSVESLSAGGALLLVSDLALSPGEEIEVLLEVGDATALISARVVRIHERTARQTSIAVTFLGVPKDIEDGIQVLVSSALERRRTGRPSAVLIFGSGPELRAQLESDLAQLGRTAITMATALEVIWHLEDRDRTYDAVLVDLDHQPAGLELLRHVKDAHPAVARAAMSAGLWESDAIQTLLTKPIDPAALAHALRVA